MKYILLALLISSCANPFAKDNKPEADSQVREDVVEKRKVYKAGVEFDQYGLFPHPGDSALLSCLAFAAGATEFDPSILFTAEGRPLRHPDIYSHLAKHGTTISKDMVNGILWCLYTDKDKDRALNLITKMIEYGRAHKDKDLWAFCTEEDRKNHPISDEDWYGRCLMTPSVIKDIYRLAKHLGWECDTDCKIVMSTTGANIPVNSKGFQRHLAVLTTVRNGLVECGLNDNSLAIVLENAAKEEPRNALYQAGYHLFSDHDQTKAFDALMDERLFPNSHIPTSENYCVDYVFQRDEFRHEDLEADVNGCIKYHDGDKEKELVEVCGLNPGSVHKTWVANDDWLPCDNNKKGRGIDWLFAASLALGDFVGCK